MKRILCLTVLFTMVLGAGFAYAADIVARGNFRVNWTYWDNADFTKSYSANNAQKHNQFQQRADIDWRFVANENLGFFARTRFITTQWGDSGTGGALGNNAGSRVAINRSYLQFRWPGYTSLVVTAGKLPVTFANSGFFSSPIMDADVTGVVVSNKWNDMVSTTLAYARAAGAGANRGARVNGDGIRNELDVAYLAVPLTFDGFKFDPYFALGFMGENIGTSVWGHANSTSVRTDYRAQSNPWWVGAGLNIDVLDPFVIYADFHYGEARQKNKQNSRKGWIADLALQYKGLTWFEPSLFGWYASGIDNKVNNGDERLPTLSGEWFGGRAFFPGNNNRLVNDSLGQGPVGTWALGLKIDKVSFVDDLTHEFNFIYARGTNSNKAVRSLTAGGLAYGRDLTTKDSIFEIDWINTYKIYEELSFMADLAVIFPSFNKNTWRPRAGVGDRVDNQAAMWRTSVGMRYNF